MPRGGKRQGSGRKAGNRPPELPVDLKTPESPTAWARLIDVLNKPPVEGEGSKDPEAAGWRVSWDCPDPRARLAVRVFAYRMRDGDPQRVVKYVHDKPIEMNVNLKISEIIREVRERKREYERSRG